MKPGKLAAFGLLRVPGYHAAMDSTAATQQSGTTWFVSRHPGAIEWARMRGFAIDRWAAHLDPSQVARGDTVIGTLPVNLAAEVCRRGARYWHLSIAPAQAWRGRELSEQDLHRLDATIECFHVTRSTHDVLQRQP